MSGPVDIGDIVGGLAARADALVRDLLPAGVRDGAEWRVGSLAGERGRSLAVHLGGARSGVWKDFAGGDAGDALDLVAAVLFRGDKKEAVAWAKSWLGLDGLDPGRLAATRRAQEAQRGEAAETEAARSRRAFRLWLEARESLRDTPAEIYLRSRGIDFARLGRQPRALRFHPRLKHREGGVWPGIVATIISTGVRGGRPIAVHRTFLTDAGRKAPVGDAKLSLGPYRGGVIPLWRGASTRPFSHPDPDERLILGEGIEDVGSAIMARPELRGAAAVSLGNLPALALPAGYREIILLGQNDPWAAASGAVHPAQRGLARAIAHFQSEDRTVRLYKPDTGKDANDVLRGAA